MAAFFKEESILFAISLMNVSYITSRDNPLLKIIRLIATGSKRAPQDLVLAEGVRVLEEVARAGYPVESVVLIETFGSVPREQALLEHWGSNNVRLSKVNESLFQTLSSVQAPQGAIALVKVPSIGLPDADAIPVRNSLIVYACGIQDPGNIGTLIRTAAAAGATMVCTEKGTVSARNPKAIRASAGAFFHLVPVENIEMNDFLKYCRRQSIQAYRTEATEGINYTDVDLRSPAAILLGNEGSGMNFKEICGAQAIRIPMNGNIESLNVAIAGAIMLFEAARQRAT
jgi:RNA methyltransferase, TrmH family